MTKNKTRKMTKSTFAIIIMGIAMVAMLAFGGTFAYFTATTNNVSGSVATAHINLSANAITSLMVSEPVVPGQKVTTGAITLTNDANADVWVFVNFEVRLYRNYGDQESQAEISGVAADQLLNLSALTSVAAWTTPAVVGSGSAQNPETPAVPHNWTSGTVYAKAEGHASKTVYGIKLDADDEVTTLKVCDVLTFNPAISQNNNQDRTFTSSIEVSGEDVNLEDVTIVISMSAESIQAFKDYSGAEGAAVDYTITEAYLALHSDTYQATNE